MLKYKTQAGDVVDEIVWRHYGTQNADMVRQVFDANPSLAEAGAVLPVGIEIILPDIRQPGTETVGVSLWD
jgi:phage tail protein X